MDKIFKNEIGYDLVVVNNLITLSVYHPNYCYTINFQTLNDLKTYLQDEELYKQLYETTKEH